MAGIDPSHSALFFRIAASERGDDGFVVEWAPSVSNRVYTVSWSTNLAEGFAPLNEEEFPASSHTDTAHAAGQEGFYRIDVRLED